MKKTLPFIILIMILLMSSCAPDIVAQGGTVRHGELPTPAAVYPDADIVYVTESGEKYHTATCPYLSESCYPISRDQAIAEGREPCKHCHPDTADQ
jgi:hypothetical protein